MCTKKHFLQQLGLKIADHFYKWIILVKTAAGTKFATIIQINNLSKISIYSQNSLYICTFIFRPDFLFFCFWLFLAKPIVDKETKDKISGCRSQNENKNVSNKIKASAKIRIQWTKILCKWYIYESMYTFELITTRQNIKETL